MAIHPRRKSDAARRANQIVRSRTVLVMLLLGIVTFAALFWRLYDLQIRQHAELQEKASAYAWTLVDSWTDQQNGDWAEVDETASVTPGNTYRVKVTVTVWAGSQSESQTFYSDEVTA